MAFTTIDNPELYFQTKLYTGNGGTNAITFDGSEDMQPDWVWLKYRSSADSHALYDSVRGTQKILQSDRNNAEITQTNGLSAFGSDGFTIGDNGQINTSSGTYASWNWKSGTSFTNDASSTGIGTIDSSGSVSTDAGFSIISYTGTGSAGTVAHGLGAVPKMIIIKSRNTTSLWGVYHQAIGNTHGLFLNATNAATSLSAYWNNTSPTSSVFSLGGDADINKSSDPLIAYCFSERQGYFKAGSYTGNGNADGTFVYTGFKPAWVMTKSSATTSNWEIKDNKRLGYNTVDTYIKANASAAEDTGVSSHAMDFLSNGFKHRGNNDEVNGSGEAYIYMAFAESPFVNSAGAVPNNAR